MTARKQRFALPASRVRSKSFCASLKATVCTCSDAYAPISDKSVKPKATLRQRAAQQTISLERNFATLTASLARSLQNRRISLRSTFLVGPPEGLITRGIIST
jgi:hypothetical protein